MRKFNVTLILIFFTYQMQAQNIAISSTGANADTSALLDLQSSNKGLLIPQISLASLSDVLTIPLPASSLLVYNTNAALSGGKGYYYNSGTASSAVWVKLSATSDLLTMAAIGNTANANGATISGNTLNMQPASTSFGGVVSTTAQSFSGNKTFTGSVTTGELTPTGRLMLPMGEISYFSISGTAINFSSSSNGSSNMVKVGPVTTFMNDMEFDNGGSNNGRLRYVGTQTRTYHVACTFSSTPATSSNVFVMGVAKNGVVLENSKALGSSSGTQFSAIHVMVSLSTNDYLELYIGNISGTQGITIKSLNLFALGM